MKRIVICFVLLYSLGSCSERRKVADGTYLAFFYETLWSIEIAHGKFTYLSSGHLGTERPITGDYRIIGDTLLLLTDSIYNKFLIDGDSCLIDAEVHTDYCLNREGSWGSRWRDINYPQIQTIDSTTKKRVLWMLETVLNGREILEYFPDSAKSIVVEEYFELNKRADLRLKSHGTEITFLTKEEIEDRKIDEYLIINDVRLGTETGIVDFQVMPEFSISILEFFGKSDGQWTHFKR